MDGRPGDDQPIAPLNGDEGYHTLAVACVYVLNSAYEKHAWFKPIGIRCSVLVFAIEGKNWDIIDNLLTARFLPDCWSLLVALRVADLANLSYSWAQEDIKKHAVKSRALILRLTNKKKRSSPTSTSVPTPSLIPLSKRRRATAALTS